MTTKNNEVLTRDSSQLLSEKLKGLKFAMMTTLSTEGTLHSRPMATVSCESPDLWFFTSDDSPKVEEIGRDAHVNLSYADPNSDVYVSVSGEATLVRDRDKIREYWQPVFAAWYPQGVEDPHLALLRVRVTGAEYWDSRSHRMRQMFEMAKAAVTGTKVNYTNDEHGTIKLNSEQPNIPSGL